MATKTRTGTRATKPARPPATAPVDRVYTAKVTVDRTRVDVPMLVLRGEWQSHRRPGRRNSVSVYRQTRRHYAHAQGLKRPRRLRDIHVRARIDARVRRLALGNPGQHRVLTGGLAELKVDVGTGFRV